MIIINNLLRLLSVRSSQKMKANNNCTPSSFIFCLNFALNLNDPKVWFYTNTRINFGFKLSLKLKFRQNKVDHSTPIMPQNNKLLSS